MPTPPPSGYLTNCAWKPHHLGPLQKTSYYEDPVPFSSLEWDGQVLVPTTQLQHARDLHLLSLLLAKDDWETEIHQESSLELKWYMPKLTQRGNTSNHQCFWNQVVENLQLIFAQGWRWIHHPFWGSTLVFEKDAIQLKEIFGGSASRLRDLFVPKQCFFNSSLVMLIWSDGLPAFVVWFIFFKLENGTRSVDSDIVVCYEGVSRSACIYVCQFYVKKTPALDMSSWVKQGEISYLRTKGISSIPFQLMSSDSIWNPQKKHLRDLCWSEKIGVFFWCFFLHQISGVGFFPFKKRSLRLFCCLPTSSTSGAAWNDCLGKKGNPTWFRNPASTSWGW